MLAVLFAFCAFDASQLREGIFTYRVSDTGKAIGELTLEIRKSTNGTYAFTMDSSSLDQHSVAIAQRDFTPLFASLQIGSGVSAHRMTLSYTGTEVRGTSLTKGILTPVATALTGVTVDQRIDWASVMALTTLPATFTVYDATSGQSTITVTSAPAAPIKGQRVVRLDYRLTKTTGTESYFVYCTEALPRVMLREDMPHGITSTLIHTAVERD